MKKEKNNMLLTGVKLFRLEYQVEENLLRTTIASNNIETVVKLLSLAYPKGFRITMSEDLGTLNGLTDNITEVIIKAAAPKHSCCTASEPEQAPEASKRRRSSRAKQTE
jgi:hypothetical protein